MTWMIRGEFLAVYVEAATVIAIMIWLVVKPLLDWLKPLEWLRHKLESWREEAP